MEQAQLELKTLQHLVQNGLAREKLKRNQTGLNVMYFERDASKYIADWIVRYTRLYTDVPPNVDALLSYAKPELDLIQEPLQSWCKQLTESAFQPTELPETFEFCVDQLSINWRKRTAIEDLNQAIEDLHQNRFDTFVNRLHETAQKVKPLEEAPTINPIQDYPRMLSEHQYRAANRDLFKKIPSGIDLIDTSLDDGWGLGEFYLLMGYTGRGKSFFGTQAGYHAAWSGFNVTIANLEMPNLKAANRMYSRITAIPTARFAYPWQMTADDYANWEKKMIEWKGRKGSLQFITFPRVPSVEDVMIKLDNLPIETDLLIIDQITNMSTRLEWQELEVIAKKLEHYAKTWKNGRGLAILTFGQVKAETKWYATLTEQHFAYGKPVCEHATGVLYLAQTEENYNQRIIRLGICKNRDGEPVTDQARLYPDLSMARIHCTERHEREIGNTGDVPF